MQIHYTEGKANRKGELTQLIIDKMSSNNCTGLPFHTIPQVTSVAEKEMKKWLVKEGN